MIRRVLRIGRWTVEFLFAVGGYDTDGVLSCLYDAGAPKGILAQAKDLMMSCRENCGFTYSNTLDRRAVVLVGPSSSGAEFLDTFVHEVRHLANSIAESLGQRLDGELPSYLAGDTARELADIVCRLGCRT